MTKELNEILTICKLLTKHMINDKSSIETIIIKNLLDRKINSYLSVDGLTIDETYENKNK